MTLASPDLQPARRRWRRLPSGILAPEEARLAPPPPPPPPPPQPFPFGFWKSGFDAATLPWTGFWMNHPPALAPSWPGTPSVGTSGAHPITTIGSAQGAALNGHATADYTGPRDASAATADQFYSNLSYGGTALFYARSAVADAGAAQPYFNAAILAYATTALFGVAFSTAGVDVWQYDGTWHTVRIPCGINAWHRIAWKYDGVGIVAQLDSGAWTAPTAVTPGWGGFSINANQLSLGSVTYGAPFDGLVACFQTTNVVLTDLDYVHDMAWSNATFGLAL